MSKRIIIGIAGASGVIYGIRMLECLKEIDYETHLIISEAGKLNIEIETAYQPNEVAELLVKSLITWVSATIFSSAGEKTLARDSVFIR